MRTIEERILNVKGIDYIVREDGKIFSTHNRGRAKYHQEIKQRMNSDGTCALQSVKQETEQLPVFID